MGSNRAFTWRAANPYGAETIIHYHHEAHSRSVVPFCCRRVNMKIPLATAPSNTYLASGSRFVACAAAWCSLHCALTPLLVMAAPAFALSEGVERIMWIGTVLLGGMMLVLGPARRNRAVLLTFGAGAVLWAASLAGRLEPLPETVTSAAGSLTLAGALVQSARVCRAGACPVCGDE